MKLFSKKKIVCKDLSTVTYEAIVACRIEEVLHKVQVAKDNGKNYCTATLGITGAHATKVLDRIECDLREIMRDCYYTYNKEKFEAHFFLEWE